MSGLPTMQATQNIIIPINPKLTEVLSSRFIPEDLPPNLLPNVDQAIANVPEVISLCNQVNENLKNNAGFTVLKVNEKLSNNPPLLISAFWNLFTCLGKPLPQYSTSELFFRVQDSGTAPIRNHYSATNRGGGFHTDGTFLPETPFYVGLMCIRQAKYGGDSILIDGRAIYRELSLNYPDVLSCLEKQYYFDCCDQLPGIETRLKPIISKNSSSLFIQYLRSYIVNGHDKAGMPLDTDAIKSMDIFEELMERQDFQFVYKLNPGEMLIFNNYFIIHGRKSFVDDENSDSKRLMIRVYGGSYVDH